MHTVYHNADEKVLIQSDKDTDGNVVNGQPSVKSVGIVHDSVAYEERKPV